MIRLNWFPGDVARTALFKNRTWLLKVAETNPSFNLTFGYRFTQYRLVFCSIPCSFVCELIIYDVTFVLLLLVLGYIINGYTNRVTKIQFRH